MLIKYSGKQRHALFGVKVTFCDSSVIGGQFQDKFKEFLHFVLPTDDIQVTEGYIGIFEIL